MKAVLIKLFWPILRFFEPGQEVSNYKASHRIILIVMGSLFIALSIGVSFVTQFAGGFAGYVPVIVFFFVGLVSVVVGTLGSEGAVSKIWGTK